MLWCGEHFAPCSHVQRIQLRYVEQLKSHPKMTGQSLTAIMAPHRAANIHSQKNVQFATGASQSIFQADPTEGSSGMIYQHYGLVSQFDIFST